RRGAARRSCSRSPGYRFVLWSTFPGSMAQWIHDLCSRLQWRGPRRTRTDFPWHCVSGHRVTRETATAQVRPRRRGTWKRVSQPHTGSEHSILTVTIPRAGTRIDDRRSPCTRLSAARPIETHLKPVCGLSRHSPLALLGRGLLHCLRDQRGEQQNVTAFTRRWRPPHGIRSDLSDRQLVGGALGYIPWAHGVHRLRHVGVVSGSALHLRPLSEPLLLAGLVHSTFW